MPISSATVGAVERYSYAMLPEGAAAKLRTAEQLVDARDALITGPLGDFRRAWGIDESASFATLPERGTFARNEQAGPIQQAYWALHERSLMPGRRHIPYENAAGVRDLAQQMEHANFVGANELVDQLDSHQALMRTALDQHPDARLGLTKGTYYSPQPASRFLLRNVESTRASLERAIVTSYDSRAAVDQAVLVARPGKRISEAYVGFAALREMAAKIDAIGAQLTDDLDAYTWALEQHPREVRAMQLEAGYDPKLLRPFETGRQDPGNVWMDGFATDAFRKPPMVEELARMAPLAPVAERTRLVAAAREPMRRLERLEWQSEYWFRRANPDSRWDAIPLHANDAFLARRTDSMRDLRTLATMIARLGRESDVAIARLAEAERTITSSWGGHDEVAAALTAIREMPSFQMAKFEDELATPIEDVVRSIESSATRDAAIMVQRELAADASVDAARRREAILELSRTATTAARRAADITDIGM